METPPPPHLRASPFRLLRMLLALAALAVQLAGNASYPRDAGAIPGWCGSGGMAALQTVPGNDGPSTPAIVAAIAAEAGATALLPTAIVVRPLGLVGLALQSTGPTRLDLALDLRTRPPPRGPPDAA